MGGGAGGKGELGQHPGPTPRLMGAPIPPLWLFLGTVPANIFSGSICAFRPLNQNVLNYCELRAALAPCLKVAIKSSHAKKCGFPLNTVSLLIPLGICLHVVLFKMPLDSHKTPESSRGRYYQPPSTDEETEAQRVCVFQRLLMAEMRSFQNSFPPYRTEPCGQAGG